MSRQERSYASKLSEHLAYTVLKILNDNEGNMLLSEILEKLENTQEIRESEKERNPRGDIKWQTSMKFSAHMFVEAGYLRKKGGIWHITPEGEKALESGEQQCIEKVKKIYKEKIIEKKKKTDINNNKDGIESDKVDISEYESEVTSDKIDIDEYESLAKTSIKKYIDSLTPYQFQDLCAALIRGMGYYVRDVSPAGPDGGIDIIAYTDPLGGKPPRIKIQVKHYTTGKKIPEGDVQRLAGLVGNEDIGVFMTSAGFSRGCKIESYKRPQHIELIDYERFVELWVNHYDKLSEEDKLLLPLHPIYFLSQNNKSN